MPALISQKHWNIKNPDLRQQAHLAEVLNIHPIIAGLLINRGITTGEEAENFLDGNFDKTHDPFLLKDMPLAVDRIRLAREKREHVLIVGDYDVDGITSTVLLYNILKRMGVMVHTHIPHRIHDGYGLNENVLEVCRKNKTSLLITVDCGVTANAEVALLHSAGIEVIIIDHHEPSREGVPNAVAVVDPKQHDCPYPFKHLAAVGLVAKLAQALDGKVPEEEMDLVALGTIADVSQLRGENRIFVKAGLPKIGTTQNKGLSALMEVAKIKGRKLKPYHAGFILGPRLNATGRMDSAQSSLDLLLSDDHQEAMTLAQSLETMNLARQKMQKDVIQDALSLVEREVNFQDHKVIVVSKEGWHKGVLGIVASRLTETYYRPTIVISLQDGVGTASARSIAGFHLHDALASCSGMLENFGGHKLAAGLTILEGNIDNFRRAINDFARDILHVQNLVPGIDVDQEILLSHLNLDLISAIDGLEPYGEGNPEPVFCSRHLTIKSKPAVLARDTLKFWVSDGQATVSAVGFGMAAYNDMIGLGSKIDLAYQVVVDDWNKAPVVQLKIKDIKTSE